MLNLIKTRVVIAIAGICLASTVLSAPPEIQYRPEAPQAAQLPTEISQLVTSLESAYATGDIDAIGALLSPRFLYQGMNKEAYLKHIGSYTPRLRSAHIHITRFSQKEDSAHVAGYVSNALGVIGSPMMLAPISARAQLIKENGHWKLYGNQNARNDGFYRHHKAFYGYLAPKDLVKYQSLLPSGWAMPETPKVRLSLTEWFEVEEPFIPYRLMSLSVLGKRQGEEHWIQVALPETDWLSVAAGKPLGFPKYVADIRVSHQPNEAWNVSAMQSGKEFITAQFQPDANAAAEFKAMERKTVLQSPQNGPLLFSMGGDNSEHGYGRLTIQTQGDSIWRALIGEEASTSVAFREIKPAVTWHFQPLASGSGKATLPAGVENALQEVQLAWKDNDIDRLMALYHPQFLHDGRDKNMQKQFFQGLFSHSRKLEWKIHEFAPEGNIARVVAEIVTDSWSSPVSTTMINDNGQWYFYGNRK